MNPPNLERPETMLDRTAPFPRTAAARDAVYRRVFVRDLALDAEIGAYAEEVGVRQPIRVSLTLDVATPTDPASDSLEDVVCYNRMAQAVRDILAEGHIRLVETLAERIAAFALDHPMVHAASVRVEKIQAVPDAACAGVEIRREKA